MDSGLGFPNASDSSIQNGNNTSKSNSTTVRPVLMIFLFLVRISLHNLAQVGSDYYSLCHYSDEMNGYSAIVVPFSLMNWNILCSLAKSS